MNSERISEFEIFLLYFKKIKCFAHQSKKSLPPGTHRIVIDLISRENLKIRNTLMEMKKVHGQQPISFQQFFF